MAQEAARRGISVTPSDVDDKERQTVASFNASTNPTPSPSATDAKPRTPMPRPPRLTRKRRPRRRPRAPTTPTPVPTLDDSTYGPGAAEAAGSERSDRVRPPHHPGTRTCCRTRSRRPLAKNRCPPRSHRCTRDRSWCHRGSSQRPAEPAAKRRGLRDPRAAELHRHRHQGQGWRHGLVQQGRADEGDRRRGLRAAARQLSSVVMDTAGYHILQVLETDPNRAVAPDQLMSQRQKAFNDWLERAAQQLGCEAVAGSGRRRTGC